MGAGGQKKDKWRQRYYHLHEEMKTSLFACPFLHFRTDFGHTSQSLTHRPTSSRRPLPSTFPSFSDATPPSASQTEEKEDPLWPGRGSVTGMSKSRREKRERMEGGRTLSAKTSAKLSSLPLPTSYLGEFYASAPSFLFVLVGGCASQPGEFPPSALDAEQ